MSDDDMINWVLMATCFCFGLVVGYLIWGRP